MNIIPKLSCNFSLDWVASFICLIYWEPTVCQAMHRALGHRSEPDRSCLHGSSRSTVAGYPGLYPNPTGAGDHNQLPLPTWPYYYLTLMTVMVAFISLGATCEGKACEDNLESHNRLFSGLFELKVLAEVCYFWKVALTDFHHLFAEVQLYLEFSWRN